MKSYKEIIEEINRNRTIQNMCVLLGGDMYLKFCHVSCHVKENGKYRWQYPNERDQFLAYIIPEVEIFCGKWFDEGMNPDALPHPICIAMQWHHGRSVRDTVLKVWPEYARMLPMVHDRCEHLGIELKSSESEWIF